MAVYSDGEDGARMARLLEELLISAFAVQLPFQDPITAARVEKTTPVPARLPLDGVSSNPSKYLRIQPEMQPSDRGGRETPDCTP
jgi:hypothetical protein